ncbi:helix-turn-helix domain-containing protein [Amycolatopsis anabasis]|uniref:helix-turn-helix domain-containing protein n=1 Tax=Amycolatopsis anabasis TaxID=1840409 RepID=UPI00131B07EF|nr:helix-turn-helix transcriptional regulator [Amycolatopsis anabasis]
MSANTLGPRARALAGALRQARESTGISLRKLAAIMEISPSVVSYWETAVRVPSLEEVANYLFALGVPRKRRAEIFDLARPVSIPDWLTVGAPGVTQQLAGAIECERDATSIVNWSLGAIPGLLQTGDYARAIIGQHTPEAEAKVQLRLSRQKILNGRQPVRFTALISELALRQVIGGAEVMSEQLEYLVFAARRENITLRVVPIGEGWHPGLIGPFITYNFAAAPSIVHLEHHRSGVFLFDNEDVTAYKEAETRIVEAGLSPEESIRFAAEAVGRWRNRDDSTPPVEDL